MNKKLLMSSALVGSLALASAAVAETKITGSAVLTYSAISGQTALASTQGYGREVQLDIANSGDLNVGGLKYKAGFSIESDAGDTNAPGGDFGEGTFFSVVSGNTEVMFNIDKAPNLSQSATPRVTTSLGTQTISMGTPIYDYSPGAQAQQLSYNTAVIQKTDVGQFSLVHIPKFRDAGGNNDGVGGASQIGGSGYDIIYSGNLGVKGLRAVAGYSKLDGQTGSVGDTKARQIGVGYNFGQIAVGVTRNDTENPSATGSTASTTAALNRDVKSDEFGITFAANDRLSFGVQYVETDVDTAGSVDEEITSVAAAYNLGGAALEVYYIQIENLGGSKTAKDVEKAAVRLTTRF
jgi:hypothetical protein